MSMKQVLLIDDSNVFRDYLKDKLDSMHVQVTIGVGPLDSMSKMRSILPDLVIIDFSLNHKSLFDMLDQKKADPNARDIPVILLAQQIEKQELTRLACYGVKKVVPKPLRIDQLLGAISEVMKIDIDVDTTPCILEARVNDNIIFVEIAQGLNREKIELLKYKIKELIALYNLPSPKILVMMTDLSLSFVDGPNLELLMEGLLDDKSVKNRNVKLLTLDTFVNDFIAGDKKYAEIQIVTDLSKAIDSLVKEAGSAEDKSAVISEKILSVKGSVEGESSLEMRFKSELENLKAATRDIRIAVVDDDVVIRGVLAKTFQTIHARVDPYESGNAFVDTLGSDTYDLIFLDLMMPGLSGHDVLERLSAAGVETPVIVLSAISQRESVLKVLQAGVKSYMIKPLKPEALLKKTIEILQASI